MRDPISREEYRHAFDSIPFSDDFQERTTALLLRRLGNLGEEESRMRVRKNYKWMVAVAAAVALLALSVSAAVLWLSPDQVAEKIDNPLLAQAFAGEDAVLLHESARAGAYTVTLEGLVSGAGISNWCDDVEESRTYAVVSVTRTDGTPLTEDNYEWQAGRTFTMTPLVAGYPPQSVNIFSLNGGCVSFLQDGVAYYVLNTEDVQIFADHTVYLAVYQGSAPSYRQFSAAEDGTLTMREDVVGCMFTLPLDPALADPEAARAFVEENDLYTELLTDQELAARQTEQEPEPITAPGTYGGVEIIEVPGHGLVTAMQAQAAAEYEAFMERESKRLAAEVENGTLSEAAYEEAVREMEESLAGLWDGSRSPDWHANPDETEVLRTKPSGAALAEEQAGS